MNVRPVKADVAENMGTEEESSVRDDLAEKQQSDPEFGLPVKLRLQSEQRPTIDQLATEAEGAKRLLNLWERSEVHECRICRRSEGRPGEQAFRKLLVPRELVQDVLPSCHEGQASAEHLIKFGAVSIGPPGKQTRFGSARGVLDAMNIIEASFAEQDHFSLS